MSADAIAEASASQSLAADPNYSVFVTANAGSGKTKVLVDRIARLLLAGSKPSAFLCITYTKAAAAEMQRRLFERLGGWCVAGDANLRRDLESLGAGGADLGRARALFAQALETPGGLKIQTIHAFCERLLARFPLEAGIAPGFDIADEGQAAELLALARAEAALAVDAPREAFRRFAERLPGDALANLLDRLAQRRADFRRYAADRHGELFAQQALRDRHGANESVDQIVARFAAALDVAALRRAVSLLGASGAKDRDCAARLAAVLENVTGGAAARATLASCTAFAFSTGGEPYKAYVTAKLSKEHPWLEQALDRAAGACIELRGRCNAVDRAEDAAAALALALKLDQSYASAKARVRALDFDDLIEHAQGLLSGSQAAPWVLYKLDGGLDHILIDEGQDTSPAQWELVAPLRSEFFAGRGARARARTVFAVGDPKQSIYGFQGAAPERFLDEARRLSQSAYDAGAQFVGPELRTSFRSAPEVLAAVDATFVDKPLAASGPQAQDEVKHLAARVNQPGVVEVWPVAMREKPRVGEPWDAPRDIEVGTSVHAVLARYLARRVREMIDAREAVWEDGVLRPMRAGDVLALVRTRGPLFRELIKAFKRAGLPVAGADRMVLKDELAVEDCLALMRVALDPADDLALACVLKGPWCNLVDDDADLFPLAYGRGKGESLYDRLAASTESKYAHARSFVKTLISMRGADAFEFLSWALERPAQGAQSGWRLVFARLGSESRDPLEELLQRAVRRSARKAPTLQRFLYDIELDAAQIKRELEAQTGAVRVMTVHGAKGLEAPLVILADTTAGVEAAPDNGLLFDELGGPFITFRSKDDDDRTAAARAAHAARMASEHWRLLYVAMTRARDRLIVCGGQHGNAKAGEAPESWRLAVHAGLGRIGGAAYETPFGEGVRVGQPRVAEASAASPERRIDLPAWVSTSVTATPRMITSPSRTGAPESAPFSPRLHDRKRFQRGRLIHGLLERLPDIAPRHRAEKGLAWLIKRGLEEPAARALVNEALQVIEDPRFASLFGPSSRAEAPIVGIAAGRVVRGVVDRLLVDGDGVRIVDFKSDRPSPRDAALAPQPYVLQMALYRAVLRTIFPGQAVSCALLWTATPHVMELPESLLDAALSAFWPT